MKFSFFIFILAISTGTFAQGVKVSVNQGSPDPSAIFEAESTTQGMLPPRMTTAQRDAIVNPAAGLHIYNIETNCNNFFNGTDWMDVCGTVSCSPQVVAPSAATHTPSATQIIWNWNTVPGASGYKWNVSNDSGTANEIGNVLSYTQTGLACNTSNTLYVWAYNACGNSVTPVTLTQSTSVCPFVCGNNLVINHNGGIGISPISKTVTYGTVLTNLSGASKCWITQNLGADQQATAANDATEASAGWSWQFNRMQGYKHNGVTRTPNTGWIGSIDENINWLAANDPCTLELGSGWRIPTRTEWTTTITGWSTYNQTYNSVLKLHAAGYLSVNSGDLLNAGVRGIYWSSTNYVSNNAAWNFWTQSDFVGMNGSGEYKAGGNRLRCLKD